MKCLFCLNDNPTTVFSDEHVFPEAIGGLSILKNQSEQKSVILVYE